jgi:PPM family protein phosphatase
MNITGTAISDTGCKRDHNEDYILIQNNFLRDDTLTKKFDSDKAGIVWAAVADGMGGANAGEIASEIVLKDLHEFFKNLEKSLNDKQLKSRLSKWITDVHQKIIEMGNEDPEKKGMGTTLAGFMFYKEKGYVFHCGDSRVYGFRRNKLSQLTTDHSLRELTKDPNTPSNIILNVIGGSQPAYVDFKYINGKMSKGDAILISSDGLHDLVENSEIEDILKKDLKGSVQALCDLAKERGGKDNISIIELLF